jgi:hypothetical protein
LIYMAERTVGKRVNRMMLKGDAGESALLAARRLCFGVRGRVQKYCPDNTQIEAEVAASFTIVDSPIQRTRGSTFCRFAKESGCAVRRCNLTDGEWHRVQENAAGEVTVGSVVRR